MSTSATVSEGAFRSPLNVALAGGTDETRVLGLVA